MVTLLYTVLTASWTELKDTIGTSATYSLLPNKDVTSSRFNVDPIMVLIRRNALSW